MNRVELYDTTLRDGAQYEGISFSVEDKLAIARALDRLGVHYIEGGWPGSNPKDARFFEKARGLELANATLAAFGSTRKAGTSAPQDANLRALLESGAPVVTLVGKTWDLHVTRVLETTLEENLGMIRESVAYMREEGRRVFFDAEHFFDGYRANPDYALRCLQAAVDGGAEALVLCDTNGGSLPDEIGRLVALVKARFPVTIGVHTHNDTGTAVAGALAAVRAGATHVQGTVNGYGERCGNADLLTIIANLKLKMGVDCVTDEQLALLTQVSRYVAEVANMPPVASQPYVGDSAFCHKGGLHVQAIAKVEHSYQHVPPQRVGNAKRVLVSELSGRSNILYKVQELGLGVELDPQETRHLLALVKERESQGFQYEGAEASFELLVRRMATDYRPPFELVDFITLVEKRRDGEGGDIASQAVLKVRVGERVLHTAAEGNGPVNALDNALRKALLEFYPDLRRVRLVDYKVRVVDQFRGTGAVVRVLIESTDGRSTWRTVGASENIIEASWMALADSLEYWLVREGRAAGVVPHA